jgi:hypothetical protein
MADDQSIWFSITNIMADDKHTAMEYQKYLSRYKNGYHSLKQTIIMLIK